MSNVGQAAAMWAKPPQVLKSATACAPLRRPGLHYRLLTLWAGLHIYIYIYIYRQRRQGAAAANTLSDFLRVLLAWLTPSAARR